MLHLKPYSSYISTITIKAEDEWALAVIRACCCQDVPRRCIQGKTLYMFEQFGVDGKLYVEVIMS